jgi:hypothetical protein
MSCLDAVLALVSESCGFPFAALSLICESTIILRPITSAITTAAQTGSKTVSFFSCIVLFLYIYFSGTGCLGYTISGPVTDTQYGIARAKPDPYIILQIQYWSNKKMCVIACSAFRAPSGPVAALRVRPITDIRSYMKKMPKNWWRKCIHILMRETAYLYNQLITNVI